MTRPKQAHLQQQQQHRLGGRADRQSHDNNRPQPQQNNDRFRREGHGNMGNNNMMRRNGQFSGPNSQHGSGPNPQYSAGNHSVYSNQSGYSGNPYPSTGNQSTRSANASAQSGSKRNSG